VHGGAVRHSILGQGVVVDRGAVIEHSIILDNTTVGRNARIRRAIVDRFNVIEPETVIGWEREHDLAAGIMLDSSGIPVLPRGTTRVRGSIPALR
jgi:glucose-1-phosphate adenylyltransferase